MMTAEEAWEAGMPGTYLREGEDLTYFPAPLCLRCLGGIHDHPGCVLKYWGDWGDLHG